MQKKNDRLIRKHELIENQQIMKYFGPKSLVIKFFYRNSDGVTNFFKFSITVVFVLTT